MRYVRYFKQILSTLFSVLILAKSSQAKEHFSYDISPTFLILSSTLIPSRFFILKLYYLLYYFFMNASNNSTQNINDASLSTHWSEDEWETDSDRENEINGEIMQMLMSEKGVS